LAGSRCVAVVPNEHAEPGQKLPDITAVVDIND